MVLFYGVLLRVDRLVSTPKFVSPDALRHFVAAEELRADDPLGWFSVYRGYAPFAWVLRLFFGMTSHQPMIQRLVTVLFSVLLIFLVARIVQARRGEWAGLFAAYLTASNPALIGSSDSGIREDPYAVLWLTLFALVFVWRPCVSPPHPISPPPGGRERLAPSPLAGEGWGGGGDRCEKGFSRQQLLSPASLRRAAIGLVVCLTFLTRVDSLLPLAGFVVLALLGNGFWRSLREWCEALAPFVVLFGIVLISNGGRHDDPFYFVDREKNMFRYWANLEFKGRPGFPTVEEVHANSRVGEPLSALQYFGGVLGWRETASRFLKGYAELLGKNVLTGIYRFDAFPNHISMVGILTLLGMASELYRKRWAIPFLIPLLFSGTAWTYNIEGGHDFRFFLVVVPFAIIAACEGAGFVWSQLQRIPQTWPRRAVMCVAVVWVVYNPWNHDRKTSFPWRVGPVDTVPAHCQYDSGTPERVPNLVGLEFREIGPLGLPGPRLTHLTPRHRFLARTWWQIPRAISAVGSYRIVVYQETKGFLSSTRYQPLTWKYPLRYWRPGQIVMDEMECLVYSGLDAERAEVRLEVAGGEAIKDATYTTVFTLK